MIGAVSKEVYDILNIDDLDDAKLLNGKGTAYINMKSKQIFVYDSLIKNSNMEPYRALKGVIAHEASHHKVSPGSLELFEGMQKLAGIHCKDNAHNVVNLYSDVIVNDYSCRQGFMELPEVYRSLNTDSELMSTVFELYSRISGEDFGCRTNVNEDLLDELLLVDYSARSNRSQLKNVYEFSKIVAPYLDGVKLPQDIIIKELKPKQKDVKGKNKSFTKKNVKGKHSYSVGTKFFDSKNLLDHYNKRKKDFVSNVYSGESERHIIEDFHPSKSFSGYLPMKSFGKFLPGLAKVKSKEVFENSISDCVIGIDSSASMVNPELDFSQAVLSGFSICDAYLKRGSQVSVFNFSDNIIFEGPCKDDVKLKELLLHYQNEGTALDYDSISGCFESVVDSFIITDADFENIDNLIDDLASIPFGSHYLLKVGDDNFSFSKGRLKVRGLSSSDKLQEIVEGGLKANGL